MDTARMPMVQPLPRIDDRKIRRLQLLYIFVLGLCLICALSLLTLSLSGIGRGAYLHDIGRTLELALALLTILCYGFGFFAAHRYSAKGLRVFALMGIFLLITMLIGIALYLVVLVYSSKHPSSTVAMNSHKKRPIVSALMVSITLGIYIPYFILTVVVVVLAFILARIIVRNKPTITQRI